MNSKILCVVLVCLVFSEMSLVFGHPTTETTVYSDLLAVMDESYEYPASFKLSSIYGYEINENSDCEWETLSNLHSPGILSVKVFKNYPVKCSWIIEAPEGKHVYVHKFMYDIVSNVEIPSDHKYDDALNVSVYDGDHVDESKRLYKIGDKKLENVKSTGRKITFSLDFKRSDKYQTQTSLIYFIYV